MEIRVDKINYKWIYGLIIILTFVLYSNSINNEYSLDDNIVVDGNQTVEKGITSIPKIFTSSYTTDKKQNYSYRPTVLSTFAIEKQFFKKLPASQTLEQKKKKDKLTQANISHFINVLLYAFNCVLLFIVLLLIFPAYNWVFSFLITLLFLVHPLHTEVVSSIKNRDEILLFIFVLMSIKYFINYSKTTEIKNLFFALLFSFAALFTKENGMALIGVVPIILFFIKSSRKNIVISFLSLLVLFVLFGFLKKALFGEQQSRLYEYFENPLMYEDWSVKRISASLYCNWFYFKMLVFPQNLSFYYGYNQIPIATWSFWQVWVSLVINAVLFVYGIITFLKRKPEGLGIILCLGLMMGVNNSFFLLPGIVADRFTYMLSIGFAIFIIAGLVKFFKIDLTKETKKLKIPNQFALIFVFVLSIYSIRTIARNPNWHDYLTLFNHDIEHLQESAKAHALISNTMYSIMFFQTQNNQSPLNPNDVEKLIYHYKESIRIDSNYLTSINNLGSVYVNFKGDYQSAIKYCEQAILLDSNYLEAQFNIAFSYNKLGSFNKAAYHFLKVIEINPDYIQVYDLYNKAIQANNQVEEGIEKLLEISIKVKNPKNVYVAIANLYLVEGYTDYKQAIKFFVKAFEVDTTDKLLCQHISNLYRQIGDIQMADMYLKQCV